jgi:Protein of unknown function (DUF1360)
MDVLTAVVIGGLAAYRLTEMVVFDNGPFDFLMEMRGWLVRAKHNEPIRRMIGAALGCVYCAGLWMSLFVAILFYFRNPYADLFVVFMAISGLQSILSTKAGRH